MYNMREIYSEYYFKNIKIRYPQGHIKSKSVHQLKMFSLLKHSFIIITLCVIRQAGMKFKTKEIKL